MSELWNETAGEGFDEKLMRLLKQGTIVYTGTVAYVRLDDVKRTAMDLQASAEAETDEWVAKAFPDGGLNPETCKDCGHPDHAYTDCGAFTGYDHINGDHECGCPGELRCDFDCSICHAHEEEED